MEKIEFKVTRLTDSDVITTSGNTHYSVAGMSSKSYNLQIDVGDDEGIVACGTFLNGYEAVSYGSSFTYFDENGVQIDTNLSENGWVDLNTIGTKYSDRFFHYKNDGGTIIYIECNDINHQAN